MNVALQFCREAQSLVARNSSSAPVAVAGPSNVRRCYNHRDAARVPGGGYRRVFPAVFPATPPHRQASSQFPASLHQQATCRLMRLFIQTGNLKAAEARGERATGPWAGRGVSPPQREAAANVLCLPLH